MSRSPVTPDDQIEPSRSQPSGHARHDRGHGHSHGMIDPSITRSREGLRAVAWSLLVLLITTIVQVVVFLATGSVALLADLIHNGGDALTAVPVGSRSCCVHTSPRSVRATFVVGAIFISAATAGVFAVERHVNPEPNDHLAVLALAAVGFVGNEIAAQTRLRAGRRPDSAALIADGNHARVDGLVSPAVVAPGR